MEIRMFTPITVMRTYWNWSCLFSISMIIVCLRNAWKSCILLHYLNCIKSGERRLSFPSSNPFLALLIKISPFHGLPLAFSWSFLALSLVLDWSLVLNWSLVLGWSVDWSHAMGCLLGFGWPNELGFSMVIVLPINARLITSNGDPSHGDQG